MQNVPNIVRDRLKAAPPAVDHPDADVLTAFAERSLPDRERSGVLEHLARCTDCREIVALALPETNPVQPVVTPSPRGWVTWPVLRWGFVAAGIVAIASFGVLQYQHRFQPQTTAATTKQSPPVEVAANEPRESVARFDAAPADKTKANKKEKLQAPAAPAFADALDAKAVADEKKSLAREESVPARVRAPQAGGGVVGGVPVGGPLPHGPRLANQWQMQNNAQNQAPAPSPPAAFPKQQNVGGATPANRQMPAAAPVAVASNATPAVAKAKPSVPLASRVEGVANNQPSQDQATRGSLKAQAAPGQMGGYVVDPSGAVVANARVTITPTPASKGGTASTVTNSQGAWLLAGLPTGNFKVQAEAPGFKTTVLDFNYDGNQPSMYTFTLSPGDVSETVEVSAAQSAQVQAETAAVGAAVANREASQAPVSGPSLTQLATLSPALRTRWAINANGALQRSLDQGSSWQTVDVTASSTTSNATSLEIVAKSSRAKEKDAAKAGKRDTAPLVFRAVAANGPDVWAGGSAGALYHSANAGDSWIRVFPTSAGATLTGDIVSLEFLEPQHGKLSTSTSEIWTTADNGQSWQKQ